MAKKKLGSKENPLSPESIAKPIQIISASIKDGLCNYTYEVLTGSNLGDTHSVKGSGIVTDDLTNAFEKFNVHLAVIDEIFKNSNIEISDIDMFHDHELSMLYNVTDFKMKISGDFEQVSLKGTKIVTCGGGGRMELKTPMIALDNLSSYKWYNELKAAADTARFEVEEYKGGKCIPAEIEEPKKNSKQLSIGDAINEEENTELEEDFENASV